MDACSVLIRRSTSKTRLVIRHALTDPLCNESTIEHLLENIFICINRTVIPPTTSHMWQILRPWHSLVHGQRDPLQAHSRLYNQYCSSYNIHYCVQWVKSPETRRQGKVLSQSLNVEIRMSSPKLTARTCRMLEKMNIARILLPWVGSGTQPIP